MRRLALITALAMLANLHPGTAVARRGTIVGADVSRDQTWTVEGSPYLLTRDVTVARGASVRIEPGVTVRANPGVRLIVDGHLGAVGTEADPITFTAADAGKRWGGIVLERGVADANRPHASSIKHAIVERAAIGVRILLGAHTIEKNEFRRNGHALVIVNPPGRQLVQRNHFYRNGIAITGRTRSYVGIFENGFWNNHVNLLPRPERPFDCGQDRGLWDIHSNDILRGPHDRYWSDDVRTPGGSGASPYAVSATNNWWGTARRRDIHPRLENVVICCTGVFLREIYWTPFSQEPNTDWVPPGQVGDPEQEPSLIGDYAWHGDVSYPRYGSCIDRRDFILRGSVSGSLATPHRRDVRIALIRRSGGHCLSWHPLADKFVYGRCSRPHAFAPSKIVRTDYGFRWKENRTAALSAGRYEVVGGDGLGTGRIRFRVR